MTQTMTRFSKGFWLASAGIALCLGVSPADAQTSNLDALLAELSQETETSPTSPPPRRQQPQRVTGDELVMPNLPSVPLVEGEVSEDSINPDALQQEAEPQMTAEERQIREKEIEREIRRKLLEQALDGTMPMRPDEIYRVINRLRTTQRAIQAPPNVEPEPAINVETINLDPASVPPEVKLAVNTVTSLTVLDQTGEPWPIVDLSFAGDFDIKTPEPGGHIVRITPMKEFARGNISMRVLDFPTPITFRMTSGGQIVHYRFDARIPAYGPNASIPIIQPTAAPSFMGETVEPINLSAGDPVMMRMLEGRIPDDAQQLAIDGGDGRTTAYRFDNKLYLRTPFQLLSPSWRSSANSSDGMTVYVIPETPIVVLSDSGDMVQVTLNL